MKSFAIYTNVTIAKKPDWLNVFRSLYDLENNTDTSTFDKPCNIHITLTQPRYITDPEVAKLRAKLTNFFGTHSKEIDVEFSSLRLDRQDATSNGCIMIDSTKNDELLKLQLDMLDFVNKNNNFCNIAHKTYEDIFVPHITIGRNLTKDQFDKAMSELPCEIQIKAVVSEVILAFIDDGNAAKQKGSKNLTVYKLSDC